MVIGNWKGNSIEDIERFFKELDIYNFYIAAPNSHLYLIPENRRALQNISLTRSTGEENLDLLIKFNPKLAILGHSELKERRDITYKKVTEALEINLKVVLCIDDQSIESDIEFLKTLDIKPTLAYEPKNAIGGDAISREEVVEVVKRVKSEVDVKILYGGGVNGDNISDLVDENIDGFLVGRASRELDSFRKILDITK